jgi:tetratricopeptide (TPR) repeat protein
VIAGEILQQRRTGSLTVVHAPLRKTLYWSQGELVLVAPTAPEDSLAEFLVRRGVVAADRALQLATEPLHAVAAFHESGLLEMSSRQTLLREWMTAQVLPLFSMDEGTAAFTDDEAIDPDKRVFLQSTTALVLDGIRSITNGLVLRRSLGDLKREIEPRRDRYALDAIPLTPPERTIAETLTEPQSIESFLKHFSADSIAAARVVIAMMTLGHFVIAERRAAPEAERDADEMQRDLELLAAIGSSDQRSLRAVALSRQLPSLDHYQLLNVPRAAPRAQIVAAIDEKKQQFSITTYPAVVRDAVQAINRRLDEALTTLKDTQRRHDYDVMLQRSGGGDDLQRLTAQRSLAVQNVRRARELTAAGDYYGAIVLLKQSLAYVPENDDAWFLLGACQERNPRWRRDATESYQRVLSINPNHVDALIALGDLYRSEGLIARAQSCYEDVLKISPDHAEAKSRLVALRKRQ